MTCVRGIPSALLHRAMFISKMFGGISLDMLGYYSDEPGRQRSPLPSMKGVADPDRGVPDPRMARGDGDRHGQLPQSALSIPIHHEEMLLVLNRKALATLLVDMPQTESTHRQQSPRPCEKSRHADFRD